MAGAVVGGTVTHFFPATSAPKHTCPSACPNAQADLLLAQLEQMGTPDGVSEVIQPRELKSSAELPTQLVRSELPKDIVLSSAHAAPKAENSGPGIVLTDEQETVVLNARQPAQRASDSTSRTLIEAPVEVKRIKTLDQYKAFKTQARGSYPQADFANEEVIVLESASSLPDNVFEIVGVFPNKQNITVLYRVNVLGLDKKLNTHSAQKMKKSSLPIILEQVL